jgi:type I restriction enzyme, R subunit
MPCLGNVARLWQYLIRKSYLITDVMPTKEASARIKINKLLEDAGWRFFANAAGSANIQLEANATMKQADLDAYGNDFNVVTKGFVDFLLLDEKGFPLIALEAKAESKSPLLGKEQARKYARAHNCRFVILSNGNLHYFWDLARGNPYVITAFPNAQSVTGYQKLVPDPKRLIAETVNHDYVALTQRPSYADDPAWQNVDERNQFINKNGLRFLRPYQLKAIKSIQQEVAHGGDRFLFEMATGTGKTLTSAAVIKLFLRSGNAQRVLFLVDRLELEDQAKKAFTKVLANDYQTVIYKENRDDWRRAEIVVTTVQSLLFNNKYRQLFSPTDFDLVISDEAHRSIGGNARSVFEYFVGYKLGLTATPRDYLKQFDQTKVPARQEKERRILLDTYRTFGCGDSQPTFRYSLLDGVKEGYLINPIVLDARTEITTRLLSEDGYVVDFTDDQGGDQEQKFTQREFEKKFFSNPTNELLCKTFLENALRDPISGEIGKSIVFAVSQHHASKLAQILNMMADRMFPSKYQSDFAVQVTSHILNAQQFTINFTNNNLLGSANFVDAYKTSKARVCVTVGMMTTGYDCPDLLNLGLFRPIFSPTEFIQIKGRGTRKHNHLNEMRDESTKANISASGKETNKQAYKLLDFFANCEYFEKDYKYDEVIELPKQSSPKGSPLGGEPPPTREGYDYMGSDIIQSIQQERIGGDGMKIDRMFYQQFESAVRGDANIVAAVEAGQWDQVIDYVNREVFDKPTEYFNLDKLRRATAVDRRLGLREILEHIFGLIPRFKSKDELLEEEFNKFVADYKPDEASAIPAMRHYFKAYVTNINVQSAIENRDYIRFATNAIFTTRDFRAVPEKYRELIPNYIKDYVPLNQFKL